MTDTINIAGISGSIRAQSYSTRLLRHMALRIPVEHHFSQIDIGALPHYDEDLDTAEAPQSVVQARHAILSSHAVLIVTPEYNHGVPGVLKNALDWLSRPAFTSCFLGKPVLFATHAPGALGGVRAQYQLRETLVSMLCRLIPMREIAVTHVARKFDGDMLTDEETDAVIRAGLTQFFDALKRTS